MGNKCDMTDRRQVSKDRGEKVRDDPSRIKSLSRMSGSRFASHLFQLAIDYGVKFLETSAKSSLNVEEVSRNAEL